MRNRIIFSIIVLLLIPTIVLAKYFNTEYSNSNTFSSSTLDTVLKRKIDEPSFKLEPDIEYTFKTDIYNRGELNTVNTQSVEEITDKDLASKIFLVVYLDGNKIYKGYLNEYNLSEYLIQKSQDVNTLEYVFSISKDDYLSTPNTKLMFVLRNYSGQEGMSKNMGFYDYEDIVVILTNPLPAPKSKQLPQQINSLDILNILEEKE